MAYKVLKKFKDLQDGNFVYEVGDEFPREGQKASQKRLEELSKPHAKYGVAFVEEYESDEERVEREAKEEANRKAKEEADRKAKADADKKKNDEAPSKKKDEKQE